MICYVTNAANEFDVFMKVNLKNIWECLVLSYKAPKGLVERKKLHSTSSNCMFDVQHVCLEV